MTDPETRFDANGDPDLRAIVLDDSETDRYLLMRMCRGVGVRIEEAADIGALEGKLNERPCDIVFIDQLLGQATGLDALAMLAERAQGAAMVKVLLTGLRDDDIWARARENGALFCIDKSNMDRATLVQIAARAREIKGPADPIAQTPE